VKDPEFSALIPCAGRSSRMGDFKALMPLGGETFIERIIGLFQGVGIWDILVVVGHEAHRLSGVLDRHGVRRVVNETYEAGMFSSIQVGVRHLGPRGRAFFVLPVDIPLVAPETLEELLAAFHRLPTCVCRPVYAGRFGHPPLISTALVPSILRYGGSGGLRGLLALYRGLTTAVEVKDPHCVMDADTAGDYYKLTRRLPPPM